MSLAMILAAFLAAAPVDPPVNRSLSESDRLNELRIEVSSALDKGQIDQPTAAEFYYGIERVRRHMIRLGIQVGYRQRVRLRARIDGLYARWAERRGPLSAEARSEK